VLRHGSGSWAWTFTSANCQAQQLVYQEVRRRSKEKAEPWPQQSERINMAAHPLASLFRIEEDKSRIIKCFPH
jgi:hypothetical protein